MQEAPLPDDEVTRVQNLYSYHILDTPETKDFDDLAQLIAQVSNCRYALISFLDQDRHWFKARKEISLKEWRRSDSFCAYTILQNDVTVIPNARNDMRFFDHPQVQDGYRIAFYAGAPIVSAAGHKIGTVCAMDPNPKTRFTEAQKNALTIIAHQVTTLLELNVKNKLLLAESDAILAEEKKIAELTLTGQDAEKNYIANELHENFAQTLAATKLYLDFAEQSKELSALFIQKSKANILQIIKDIKALTRSMVPSTYHDTNYLAFIQEMLDEYGKQHGKIMKFKHEGKLDCYEAGIGLTLFRIIQYQLKNADNAGAKKISIRIKTAKLISLEFVDDGKIESGFEQERKMLLHHITTRIDLLHGKVEVGKDKHGNNLLKVEIPLSGQ